MKTVGDRLTEVEARLFDRVPGFLTLTVSGLFDTSRAGVTLAIGTHKPPATEVCTTYLYVSAQERARTDIDAFVAELAERIKRATQ